MTDWNFLEELCDEADLDICDDIEVDYDDDDFFKSGLHAYIQLVLSTHISASYQYNQAYRTLTYGLQKVYFGDGRRSDNCLIDESEQITEVIDGGTRTFIFRDGKWHQVILSKYDWQKDEFRLLEGYDWIKDKYKIHNAIMSASNW